MDRNAKLDVKATVVANKTVKLHSREYKRGDVIKDSTIEYRKLNQLYRVGVVTTKEEYELKKNRYGRVIEEVVPVVETASIEALEATHEEKTVAVEEVTEVTEEAESPAEVYDATVEDTEDKPRRGRPKKVD